MSPASSTADVRSSTGPTLVGSTSTSGRRWARDLRLPDVGSGSSSCQATDPQFGAVRFAGSRRRRRGVSRSSAQSLPLAAAAPYLERAGLPYWFADGTGSLCRAHRARRRSLERRHDAHAARARASAATRSRSSARSACRSTPRSTALRDPAGDVTLQLPLASPRDDGGAAFDGWSPLAAARGDRARPAGARCPTRRSRSRSRRVAPTLGREGARQLAAIADVLEARPRRDRRAQRARSRATIGAGSPSRRRRRSLDEPERVLRRAAGVRRARSALAHPRGARGARRRASPAGSTRTTRARCASSRPRARRSTRTASPRSPRSARGASSNVARGAATRIARVARPIVRGRAVLRRESRGPSGACGSRIDGEPAARARSARAGVGAMVRRLCALVVWSVFAIVAVGGLAVFAVWRELTQDLPDGHRAARLPPADGDARPRGRRHADRRVLRRAALSRADRGGCPSRCGSPSSPPRTPTSTATPASTWPRIVRATIANFRRGEIMQGASTITQQVVKQLLLSPERSFERKSKELILALELESKLTKDEIFYLYLNHIYFGGGTYGICGRVARRSSTSSRARCRSPRRRCSRDCRRRRAATTRGAHPDVPPATAALRPRPHARRGLHHAGASTRRRSRRADRSRRRQERLRTTRRPGTRSTSARCSRRSTAARSRRWACRCTPPRPAPAGGREEALREACADRAPARRRRPSAISGEPDRRFLEQQRIRRRATAAAGRRDESARRDPDPHRLGGRRRDAHPGREPPSGAATSSRRSGRARRRRRDALRARLGAAVEGALVAIDPETGQVKAMVGGVDFHRSQFNRAVQARRQPGSAFKPLIYAAAIDHGYTATTMVDGRADLAARRPPRQLDAEELRQQVHGPGAAPHRARPNRSTRSRCASRSTSASTRSATTCASSASRPSFRATSRSRSAAAR